MNGINKLSNRGYYENVKKNYIFFSIKGNDNRIKKTKELQI